jgi:protein gp37
MADGSKIEWTDATWNPIKARLYDEDRASPRIGFHCEKVSTACANCYAERMNMRGIFTGLPYEKRSRRAVDIFLDEKTLLQPLHWKRPRRIFPCSMTDLFGEWVSDAMLDRIFAVMALCPQHIFQVLTKRPQRMRYYIESARVRAPSVNEAVPGVAALAMRSGCWADAQYLGPAASGNFVIDWPVPNVWLGATAEDQETANARIPILLQTPAASRFVSCEPLLGPVDLTRITNPHTGPAPENGEILDALCGRIAEWPSFGGVRAAAAKLDWVICGGESGPHARPMHPDWARALRDQCAAAGIGFFFKQWGMWKPLDQFEKCYAIKAGAHCVVSRDGQFVIDTDIADPPRAVFALRVSKKAAGRLLDGIEHNEFPA